MLSKIYLDNIVFDIEGNDDLPNSITIGGKQILATKVFAGGEFSVQALGNIEDDISWQGTFKYRGALDKAIQIHIMRISGKTINLNWGPLNRKVKIREFKFTPRNAYEVDYEIILAPVSNPARKQEIVLEGVDAIEGYKPISIDSSFINTENTDTESSSSSTNYHWKIMDYIEPQKSKPYGTYITKKGDDLMRIAAIYYGDSSLWEKIYEANKDKLKSSIMVLEEGIILKMPGPYQTSIEKDMNKNIRDILKNFIK